jgi:hypothetical protein
MKCLPTNNIIPANFNECCNCSHYEDCFDKRDLKREGIIWLFVHFIKNYFIRTTSRKTANLKVN